MTTQTTQTAPQLAAASMPRVNLMPPELAEAARFRQIQFALAGAVLLTIALVGLLYHHEHSGVAGAKEQLAQAQVQQSVLQGQLNGLASVSATYADVQNKQAELATAMGSEVRWSFFLNDMTMALPSNVWMSSLSVSETGAAPAAAPTDTLGGATAPAPTVTPIGSVTMGLTGFTHDDVAAWLDAMAKNKYFLSPSFDSSTEGTIGTHKTVTFNGSLALSSAALSHRFTAPASATAPATGATP